MSQREKLVVRGISADAQVLNCFDKSCFTEQDSQEPLALSSLKIRIQFLSG
jgi:hypothetical protein